MEIFKSIISSIGFIMANAAPSAQQKVDDALSAGIIERKADDPGHYKCLFCNKTGTGCESMVQHLDSDPHKKKINSRSVQTTAAAPQPPSTSRGPENIQVVAKCSPVITVNAIAHAPPGQGPAGPPSPPAGAAGGHHQVASNHELVDSHELKVENGSYTCLICHLQLGLEPQPHCKSGPHRSKLILQVIKDPRKFSKQFEYLPQCVQNSISHRMIEVRNDQIYCKACGGGGMSGEETLKNHVGSSSHQRREQARLDEVH